jgi:predicted dehydrogenase
LPVHLHQDFVQWPPTRNCEAIGDKGKAVLDFAALSVTLQPYGDAPPITERWDAFERNDLFVSELSHFLDCVEHRSRPLVDLAEGFASLRIALAIKESLTTGAAVALSTTAHA